MPDEHQVESEVNFIAHVLILERNRVRLANYKLKRTASG